MIGQINVCEAKKEKGDIGSFPISCRIERGICEKEIEKSRKRAWEELRLRDKEVGGKIVGNEKKRSKG